MGIGAFIWIPLSVAVGRRPVFLLCTVITLLTTVWVGLAGSFYQILVAVSFLGLSVGMSTSMVNYQQPLINLNSILLTAYRSST